MVELTVCFAGHGAVVLLFPGVFAVVNEPMQDPQHSLFRSVDALMVHCYSNVFMGEMGWDGPPDVVQAALVAIRAQVAHSKAFLAIPPPNSSLAFPSLGEKGTSRSQTQKDAPAAAAVHVVASMANDSGALLSPAKRIRSCDAKP